MDGCPWLCGAAIPRHGHGYVVGVLGGEGPHHEQAQFDACKVVMDQTLGDTAYVFCCGSCRMVRRGRKADQISAIEHGTVNEDENQAWMETGAAEYWR